MVWVLDRSYQHPKAAIVETLEEILDTDVFVIDNEDLVRSSVEDFKTGRGSFADYLIASLTTKAGCTETVTFDRKLSRAAGFRIL